jgi:hypothetical protein
MFEQLICRKLNLRRDEPLLGYSRHQEVHELVLAQIHLKHTILLKSQTKKRYGRKNTNQNHT